MMGIVVRYQHCFPKNRLSISPRNLCEQIRFRIAYELLHGFEILVERLNTLVPRRCGRWRRLLWPIILRPAELFVFRIAAEIENVPLRDAQMFEEHPCRMRQSLRDRATQFSRKITDDLVESRMRVAAIEQFEKMFAERLV